MNTTLAPGTILTADFDLAQQYAIAQPGRYEVAVARNATNDDFAPEPQLTNTAEITVK